MEELAEQLRSITAHPDLVTVIGRGVMSVERSLMIDVGGHPDKNELQYLIDEQNEIR